MKLLCSLLLLLLYLAVTGRPSDAQLLQQDDAPVSLQYRREGDPGLQLQAGTNIIDATWDEVPGASYYNISWTPNGNGTNTVDGTSSSGTYTYTITGLVSCTKYTVTVQPGDKETDVGEPLTASTTTITYDPYAVTTVTVATVVDQSSRLAVGWTKAEGAGNCPVTYRVTWTPASVGGSRQDTTSALSYTITGLAASTTYTVCVAATTDGGSYTNDRCRNGTTDVNSDPGLKLSAGTSSIDAYWEEVSGASYYSISWSPNNGTNTVDGGSSNPYIYTITGLMSCTYYTVTVQPGNKGTYVGGPLTSSITTLAPDPFPVTGVMVDTVPNTPSQLSVSWSEAEIPDGGKCAITYKITWKVTSGGQSQKEATTSSLSYTIKDLNAYTSYHVCVAATTNRTYTDDKCNIGMTDEDTPGPPSNTKIESHTGESLLVVWSSPEEPRGIITSYRVAWSPPDSGNGTKVTVNSNVTWYNITSLKTCVNYTVTVTAATSKGYGEQVHIRNTTEAPPPPAPPVTCKKVVSSHQVTVTWPPVDTQCPINSYRVNYTGDVLWSDETRNDSRELQTTYADLSDLTPWTTYTVCVAGVVGNDIVGAWDCCSSTTLEAAPGPPAALTIASVSRKTVTVSWAPPKELNGVLTDYQVAWDNGYTNLTTNVTTYTVSDLQPKSQFTVAVKARTAAGWGPSAAVSGATADDGVNVGAVVGGVVGGLLLLALLVAAVFFRHKIMDTFQAAKHTRPPPAGPPPVTIVHPGDQVKKHVMTHDPAHKHALYSGSAVPRALREEVSPHKAPSVQSPGGLALNTVTTHPYSDHTYVNEISDEDDPIYMSLD
ncbi:netrin receptor unc-40 [Procambarus clarkii]|uniref:netrin receptor unc-40 n=1 Tax=Procambarus clarkii TaxID=6728 RepID=UPI0037422B14